MRRYISKILALMGVGVVCTACYGTPHIPYRDIAVDFDGEVVNEVGEPIMGIQVTATTHGNHGSITNSDGRFRVSVDAKGRKTVLLEFEDVDGEANGGDFETKAVSVSEDGKEFQRVVLELKK